MNNGHIRAAAWFLASVANALLLLMVWIQFQDPRRHMPADPAQQTLLVLIVSAPILSLLVLLPHYGRAPVTWLSLLLRRKAEEERARLRSLGNDTNAQ